MRQIFRSKFKVTQEFGVNPDFYKKWGLKAHEGLDCVPTGSQEDIISLLNGVVVKDEDNSRTSNYGIYVTIWTPEEGVAFQYCHMRVNLVSNGDMIIQGQTIGFLGSTGLSTAKHLHLNRFITDANGLRLNKNNGYLGGIDPLPFLLENIEPIDTTALDECKSQLTDEIKKKNENYNWGKELEFELEGKKAEILSYQNYIKQLATTLNDPNADQNKILGLVKANYESVLTKEDQIRQLQKDLQDRTSEAENNRQALDEMTGKYLTTEKDLRAREKALQEVLQALETANKNLQTCQQVQELKFRKLFWRIYLGEEMNDK